MNETSQRWCSVAFLDAQLGRRIYAQSLHVESANWMRRNSSGQSQNKLSEIIEAGEAAGARLGI